MTFLPTVQLLFVLSLGAILCWLVWNGWTTGSVWVRGVRKASSTDPALWATPVDRKQHPGGYWLAMSFYGGGIAFALWAAATILI
ncbi:MAG: hypothetical protein AAGE43_19720 [Pseudomonadota bacterium]